MKTENKDGNTRDELKNWFKTGLKPTQLQFWAVWDSFWHKKDAIPLKSIEGIQEILDQKASVETLQNHILEEGLHGNNLIERKIDSYTGNRLSPKDDSLNGFQIQKAINGTVGFLATNADEKGSGALACISVGASDNPYVNGTSISQFGASYYLSYLRNSGALYSDTSLSIMATGKDGSIDLRTGPGFTETTSKFTVTQDGKLIIGIEPDVDNSQTKLLARAGDGQIMEVEKESLQSQHNEQNYKSFVGQLRLEQDKTNLIEIYNTYSLNVTCDYVETGIYILEFDTEAIQRFATIIETGNIKGTIVAKFLDSKTVRIETFNFKGDPEDFHETVFVSIKTYPFLDK